MKTVLVTLDFSEFSAEVEKIGYQVASAIGASVTLMTIVNKSVDYTTAYLGLPGLNYATQWEDLLQRANIKLEEVKNSHPDVATNIILFIGTPKTDIVEAASEPDVSFVVVGKYGRRGISHLVMGGTTAYIVQHSVKPVIVVPFRKNKH
jgi:nucleotide-binding universal stress UspA family protein